MLTRHLMITGRVQGVGFRYALCDEAEKHGVTGWVRNRRDGRVEALVQGSAEAVDAVIAWARLGPAMALVTDLKVAPPDAEPDRHYPRFERWPTA